VSDVLETRPASRRPLVDRYRLMLLIRVFEERAAELFQQGVILGTAHSCVGQEAIAVGAAGVMREGDYSSAIIARTGISSPRAPISAG